MAKSVIFSEIVENQFIDTSQKADIIAILEKKIDTSVEEDLSVDGARHETKERLFFWLGLSSATLGLIFGLFVYFVYDPLQNAVNMRILEKYRIISLEQMLTDEQRSLYNARRNDQNNEQKKITKSQNGTGSMDPKSNSSPVKP